MSSRNCMLFISSPWFSFTVLVGHVLLFFLAMLTCRGASFSVLTVSLAIPSPGNCMASSIFVAMVLIHGPRWRRPFFLAMLHMSRTSFSVLTSVLRFQVRGAAELRKNCGVFYFVAMVLIHGPRWRPPFFLAMLHMSRTSFSVLTVSLRFQVRELWRLHFVAMVLYSRSSLRSSFSSPCCTVAELIQRLDCVSAIPSPGTVASSILSPWFVIHGPRYVVLFLACCTARRSSFQRLDSVWHSESGVRQNLRKSSFFLAMLHMSDLIQFLTVSLRFRVRGAAEARKNCGVFYLSPWFSFTVLVGRPPFFLAMLHMSRTLIQRLDSVSRFQVRDEFCVNCGVFSRRHGSHSWSSLASFFLAMLHMSRSSFSVLTVSLRSRVRVRQKLGKTNCGVFDFVAICSSFTVPAKVLLFLAAMLHYMSRTYQRLGSVSL
ncbi:unnamed protein product [Caenorhabditis auriculariae]|uniref:Uncharacterized protein n=1 Tax=Caenorhabditis auriculariae TaxID=2777116 RepID=A0A8S1GV25_9PELO|nr:unnamed protein product [Caenorhabditis auriculariae]